jgi:tRNA nucleotidyltransferase (CCA-adding enzyme)
MRISAQRVEIKFLHDRYNAVIFKKGRARGIYLVGGYVRDALRGVSSQDRDFVVTGDLMSFVGGIRNSFGGTMVRFRKAHMARLALPNGITFDFSARMGTIEEDLSRRDFTINALSWSPEMGIIDMHNGMEDLAGKRIRMISEANLISDPLRLLRAYRFAAELGGSIEKKTRNAIKTLHNRIENASPERITLELFHLLNSKGSSRYLKGALTDRVLSSILSFDDKVLEGNIRAISVLEGRMLEVLPGDIKDLLDAIFSQNLTYKGLLCLELLLQGSDHRGSKVRMSSHIKRRIKLSSIGVAEMRKERSELPGRLFDIFVRLRDAALDVLIVSGRIDLIRKYDNFTEIMRDGLLSSQDIMTISGVGTGPIVGRYVLALKRAEFEGKVKSRIEAIDFVRKEGKRGNSRRVNPHCSRS